jgi:hypothetical protein
VAGVVVAVWEAGGFVAGEEQMYLVGVVVVATGGLPVVRRETEAEQVREAG